jgi:phosphopantothenoylcysteine decarboxylase/phosphopantothenate--cysteine ligase
MKKNVLVGVTGSIAAYKAADLVRRLQDKDCDVRVVMSACAEQFITPLTLETLSKNVVVRSMFERDANWEMAHISLAQWADVYVIAPATANMIGKIASGLADDMVSCTAMTTKAPVVIAPAMNTGMLTNKIVEDNIATLKKYNMSIVEPKAGKLACGDVGKGALADIDTIVDAVVALLK